ncbi:MAG: tryptophan--tRNA ligase [Simkaniaceae bacterium]|nr:tryptophan--tRNA ligase [Simkaniaceae bacterium]MCF7852046.1 tryptophan--tRNA ligase [Simkaniaceae bacterium]
MSRKKIILTGDRPTGKLHLGHYVGSLKARVDLQSNYEQYVMIADAQALTDHYSEPEKVREHVLEVAMDYLSVGINPKETTIFIQSMIPEIHELAMYFLNLVTWNRLQHNPTVKAEIRQKGFKEGIPAGFMTYPVFQAADITAFHADLVPVGEDQRPMIEQTNEIVRSFNRIYKCDVLKEVEAHVPKIARLPGIDGSNKMSKTLGNAIYLSEDPDSVVKKIKKMTSDPNHVNIEDPGQVEGNPVFIYLDCFCSDIERLDELKAHYARGGLGDGVLKKYLAEVLVEFLKPIQRKRAEIEKNKGDVLKILKKGTEVAREKAADTLKRVKQVMHLDYFA